MVCFVPRALTPWNPADGVSTGSPRGVGTGCLPLVPTPTPFPGPHVTTQAVPSNQGWGPRAALLCVLSSFPCWPHKGPFMPGPLLPHCCPWPPPPKSLATGLDVLARGTGRYTTCTLFSLGPAWGGGGREPSKLFERRSGVSLWLSQALETTRTFFSSVPVAALCIVPHSL